MTEYIRRIYPLAWAIIAAPDGTMRDATPEELRQLFATADRHMDQSMIIPELEDEVGQ